MKTTMTATLAALTLMQVQPAQAATWPTPVNPLPQLATTFDKRFQPALDFDTDVCFNVSAVDSSANITAGASTYATRPPATCRNANYLKTSNVYSRARCNHGYCARVYAYFWQSDFSHAYDWETIIVWTSDNGTSSQVVGVSRDDHGDWDTRATSGGQLRFLDDTTGSHVKMVYHYETLGFSHLFRFSKTDGGDEPPENGTGAWLVQPLVSWNGYPSLTVRNKIANYDFGSGNFEIKDARFATSLAAALQTSITPGFDPNTDSGTNSPGCPSGSTIC
jgi:hypothetical protein